MSLRLRPRSGIGLLAALWLVVACSAVGLALAIAVKQRRLEAANSLEYTQARLAGLSGLEHALLVLQQLRAAAGSAQADVWRRIDGELRMNSSMANTRYDVHAGDVRSKLNINTATSAELTRFFVALAAPSTQAYELAAAIADWRDPDDAPTLGGGELETYESESRPILPANRPFASLTDLQHVRGMTRELFLAAAPHLTVFGDGRINYHTADRPVLLALNGFSEEAVATLFARRAADTPVVSLLELATLLPIGPRYQLEWELPNLSARMVDRVDLAEVVSTGSVGRSPIHVTVTAIVAKAPTGVSVSWKSVQ